MLKLDDTYYLDTDQYQYIVMKRVVNDDPNSKYFGTESFINLAYYGTIEGVAKFIFEHKIKNDNTLLENIDKCIEIKNQLVKELKIARR